MVDALGSTQALTDSSGALTTQYTYDPYGKTSSSGSTSANSQQYTGRENDGTGVYYYRARYDSPSFGRFISGDPIGLAGGLNIYAYVRGNPLSGIDPLGLFDILAYSQWMNYHAHTSSQHQCTKYVRRGIEAGDADITGHPSDAKNYGLTLTNNGFTPIPSENYTPQAGDTVVFQPHPGGNPPGYIEIFNSDQWVSNFNKNHFSPGIGYENSTYQIYRAPNQ
ncbi:RHS repeat-associated core domain-containing protein [Pseudomonas sp. Pseusp11]|uniref:RHS repeat-associated core domain-containing protein n=1 Tax=Pseudomonas sp. Pseusp11 TaxID=3243003 RepID=UPI0039B44EB5